MRKLNKRALYEKIMRNISKEVKSVLNEEGRVYDRLNSDHIKSYTTAKYDKNNVETDTWGEPIGIGSYIFGIFINALYSNAKLMVGCIKEIKDDGTITATLGDGDVGILNKTAGFKRLSPELLHDLFAYNRLAPINKKIIKAGFKPYGFIK